MDARRLVVITSYNTAQYQIETIDWEASPARTEFTLKTRDPNTGKVTKEKISVAAYLEKKWKVRLSP